MVEGDEERRCLWSQEWVLSMMRFQSGEEIRDEDHLAQFAENRARILLNSRSLLILRRRLLGYRSDLLVEQDSGWCLFSGSNLRKKELSGLGKEVLQYPGR